MPNGEQITVTLVGPLDPNADYYKLRYDDNPSFTSPLVTAPFYSLTRTITQVSSTGPVYVEALAGNDAGESDWSAPDNATPLQLEAPGAPSFLTVTEDSIEVQFPAVANAQSYDLQVGTSPGASDVLNLSGIPSPYAFPTGLTDDTPHYFRARAQGEDAGVWSGNYQQDTLASGGGPGDITISVTASVTTGVAPLTVIFDATATTAFGITKPLHELDFAFNFNDGGGGTWAYGDIPDRNVSRGSFIAAHTYLTPGTFTPTLAVRGYNGEFQFEAAVATITVDDPDTTYAGTATVLVSRVGGAGVFGQFSGSGTPQQITTTNWATVQSAINGQTNKRLLFARNESWVNVPFGSLTPGDGCTIGSFGAGSDPLFTSSSGGGTMIALDDVTVCRILDLDLEGNSGPPSWPNVNPQHGIVLSGTTSDVVVRGVRVARFNGAGISSDFSDQAGASDQVVDVGVIDCDLEDSRDAGLLAACKRWAVMGTRIYGANVGTPLRIRAAQQSVFQHNRIGGAGNTVSDEEHLAGISAPDWTGEGDAGSGLWAAANQYSEEFVFSDNEVDMSTRDGLDVPPFAVAITNRSGAGQDERIRNYHVMRNLLLISGGNAGSMRRPLFIYGTDVTCAANVVDYSGGNPASNEGAITSGNFAGAVVASSGMYVLHNTVYRAGSTGEHAVYLTGDNHTAIGNLAYAPSGTALEPVVLTGSGGTIANNTTLSMVQTSPGFDITEPQTSSAFYVPEVGFYGADGGLDLATTKRAYRSKDGDLLDTLTPDLGAWDQTHPPIETADDEALAFGVVFDELPQA